MNKASPIFCLKAERLLWNLCPIGECDLLHGNVLVCMSSYHVYYGDYSFLDPAISFSNIVLCTCLIGTLSRRSRPGVLKKGVLRNFTKFTGKHLCQSLFFNKVAGLRPATLLKKRLWHRCFPMNFAKFLRTPFSIEHFRGILVIERLRVGYMNTSLKIPLNLKSLTEEQ